MMKRDGSLSANGRESIRFLKKLFAETKGYIELRCFPPGERIFTLNYKEIAQFVQSHLHQNIYFGIATRRTTADGTKSNCMETSTLWADVD